MAFLNLKMSLRSLRALREKGWPETRTPTFTRALTRRDVGLFPQPPLIRALFKPHRVYVPTLAPSNGILSLVRFSRFQSFPLTRTKIMIARFITILL